MKIDIEIPDFVIGFSIRKNIQDNPLLAEVIITKHIYKPSFNFYETAKISRVININNPINEQINIAINDLQKYNLYEKQTPPRNNK